MPLSEKTHTFIYGAITGLMVTVVLIVIIALIETSNTDDVTFTKNTVNFDGVSQEIIYETGNPSNFQLVQ